MSKKIIIEDFASKALINLKYLLESVEENIDIEKRYIFFSTEFKAMEDRLEITKAIICLIERKEPFTARLKFLFLKIRASI